MRFIIKFSNEYRHFVAKGMTNIVNGIISWLGKVLKKDTKVQYPFRLRVIDGRVEIPYHKTVSEIEPFLKKDMTFYKAGILALAWKGSQESFSVMCRELHNSDYYRRKLTLENIIYHDLFEMNAREVLGEAVLDGHELVVASALKKIVSFQVPGLSEEVSMVLECWPDNKEIQELCQYILQVYGVDYSEVLTEQADERLKRDRENLIFQGNSQYIVQDRMNDAGHFGHYMQIIQCYYPHYTEADARALIENMAKEGCGYASLSTTLVQYFAEKESQFRTLFGYDILQNGEYVTDLIMLDFYCMTDGPEHGMSLRNMELRFQQYCSYYQLSVNLEVLDELDMSNYAMYMARGYLLLFAGDFTMYYKKYKPVEVKGWHVMNVCEMQLDGTVTLVTWGRKYTLKKSDLDPNDFKFVFVTYQ